MINLYPFHVEPPRGTMFALLSPLSGLLALRRQGEHGSVLYPPPTGGKTAMTSPSSNARAFTS